MGTALMKAAAKQCGAANIGFSDTDSDKAHAAAASLGAIEYANNKEAALGGTYLVLAVKPQVAQAVLKELAPVFARRSADKDPLILVSVVAGLSMDSMYSCLGMDTEQNIQPVIRLMPNTPALVSKGIIALSASAACSEEQISELERCLSKAALIDRIEEKFMNAVTALSGSGPAFVYIFIEALADAGVRVGLPRDKALSYAARTVLGSAAMVEENGKHPAALKDAVCSPAGTTIAGVCALEDKGFRSAAIAAVEAAYKRACEL